MSSSFQLDFLPTFFFARLLPEFVDLLISDSASLAASSPFSPFHIHSQLMECFHQRVRLRSMIHHQLALRRMKFRSHEHFFAKPPCSYFNTQCAYSVKENSLRGLLVTPRANKTLPKYINIIYEFCLARQRHDV